MIARARLLRFLVPVLLAVAATATAPRRADAVVPGLNGRIVFVSIPDPITPADDDYEIFTMEPDGSDLQRLTTNTADEYSPFWSPDGTKIAFSSNISGDYEIWVMDADGSNPVNLTKTPGFDATPAWSPDGTKIAFARGTNGSDYDLWVMNANGSGQKKLTTLAGSEIYPSWSPDGSKILFEKQGAGFQVYVMNANGSNPVNLTAINGNDNERQPVWSPDGQLIAFYGQVGFQNEIYTMKLDGSQRTNITNAASNDFQPVFSPDGTKIVFGSNRPNGTADHIWVMDVNGANPIELSDMDGGGETPDWQPLPSGSPVVVPRPKKYENDLIVFSSDRVTPGNPGGDPELYTMTAVGKDLKQITSNTGVADLEPEWSPDGKKIVFARLAAASTNSDIFLVNFDGANLVRLTSSIETDSAPSWAPNARSIAWVRDVFTGGGGSERDIFTMDQHGNDKLNLTNSVEDEDSPTWGVDSRRIAFVRHLGANPDIFVMDADGTNQVNVTNTAAGTEEIEPAWAPSGKVIAFARRDAASFPFYEIWTIKPDGTGLTRITSSFETGGGRVDAATPAWSPDSRFLVYSRTRSPADGLQSEVVTVRADGAGPADLTNHPALDESPSWALR